MKKAKKNKKVATILAKIARFVLILNFIFKVNIEKEKKKELCRVNEWSLEDNTKKKHLTGLVNSNV